MSGLRGKLQRAFAHETDGTATDAAPQRAPADGSRTAGVLAEALRRHEARKRLRQAMRPARPAVALPEGQELTNARGSCYLRRLEYPLDLRHGDCSLGSARSIAWPRVAQLAKCRDLDANLDQCLFFDTETTGLGGGVGTLVFLCGLGFFEDDRFVVEQLFLRSFAEEPAALLHVEAHLARRPWLVSFVGKTFDRHRLATRMSMHRVDSDILTERHIDLYYLARRAWKGELPNYRLHTVEEFRLGVHRDDDLPGSMAPAAFLEWLRDGSGPVDRVLEHNRIDVLSLVTLLTELASTPLDPEPPPKPRQRSRKKPPIRKTTSRKTTGRKTTNSKRTP